MPLLKENTYTIEDIYALPEGERAELIDGQIYYMAPPSRKHQRISTRLTSIIDRYIEDHQDSAKFMLPRLQFIWMNPRTHMLNRISLLSVIQTS